MHSKSSRKYVYSACWGLGAGVIIVISHLIWGSLITAAIALLLIGSYLGWQQLRASRSTRRSRNVRSSSEPEPTQIWSFQVLEVSDETRVTSPPPQTADPTTANPRSGSSKSVNQRSQISNPAEQPTIAKPVAKTRPPARQAGQASQSPGFSNQRFVHSTDERIQAQPLQASSPLDEQTAVRQVQNPHLEAGQRSGISDEQTMTRPMRPPSKQPFSLNDQARTIMRHPPPGSAGEQNNGLQADPDAPTLMKHQKKSESDVDRPHS